MLSALWNTAVLVSQMRKLMFSRYSEPNSLYLSLTGSSKFSIQCKKNILKKMQFSCTLQSCYSNQLLAGCVDIRAGDNRRKVEQYQEFKEQC